MVRAYAQEKAEQAGFDAPNREYVTRNLKLISTVEHVHAGAHDVIRHDFPAGALAGRQSESWRHDFPRRTHRLLQFHGAVDFPDGRARLRDKYFPARRRIMGRINYILDAQPKISDAEARRSDRSGNPRRKSKCGTLRSLTPPREAEAERGRLPRVAGNGQDERGGAPAPVLRDINLKIPAGSTLAIVGPTGSGKTTLAAF